MILNAYSILDTKCGIYREPFYCHHHHIAKRMICEAVNDERTQLAKFPADYALMCVGTWDDETGAFTSTIHLNLGTASAIYSAEVVSNSRLRNLVPSEG